MTTDPAEQLDYAPTSPVVRAGRLSQSVEKAAEFAGLPADVVGLLTFAATVAERHAAGFMPQDGDIGMLGRELGAFVSRQREVALARRQAAA